MKLRRIAAWAVGVLLLAGVALSAKSLLFVAQGGAAFPTLSGEHSVGYRQIHLVDAERAEIFSDDPEDVRELVVDVYYPAEPTEGASPYLERDLALPLLGIPYMLLAPIRPNHVTDAAVAVSGTPYPLLVFSPGFGGPPLYYSSLLEQVASHGYVVAALYHPYSTEMTVFPDGRVISYNLAGSDAMYAGTEAERDAATQVIAGVWAEDASFVVDALLERFEGIIDEAAIGIFGHSFGGQNAAAAMSRDDRFMAGLNMDGTFLYQPVLESGVDGAFMFIYSAFEPPYEYLEESGQTLEAWRERWATRNRPPVILQSASATYTVVIDGTAHDTFATDLALLQPMFWFIIPRDTVGEIDPDRALDLLTRYITAFFGRHLKGQDMPLLAQQPAPFPDVHFGPNVVP